MHDVTQINIDNRKRIEAAWTTSAEHPHAVVTYDGLHAMTVRPAISKAWADEAAREINAQQKVGVHAVVL